MMEETFLQLCLTLALVFGVCAVAGFIQHRQDSEAIKSQTALGIQSVVAVATLSITASHAEEATEIHGVPTPNLVPPTPTAKATP